MWKACLSSLFAVGLAALVSAPAPASAMDIQRVVSPGGIEAWLVESHENPLIAMRFAFRGGSGQDPEGKEGLAYFVSGMMDEGAGELNSVAFQERTEELAIRMNFDAGRDVMTGSFQTLTANKDEAFDLLRLALTEPRIDPDAVERVRLQILASLKYEQNDPQTVASNAWDRLAFGTHPYGQPIKGSVESVGAITREDLQDYIRRNYAQDNLLVSVVGDVTPDELGKLLDRVFGDLPKEADLRPVAEANPPLGPAQEIIEMDVPQSVAQFGHRGFPRKDDDFMASYILNYIIGGGGFSSRLMEEVREKRGLAYSVYSYLFPYRHGSVFVVNVATENKAVAQSREVIESELQRFAKEGPTEEELANAKSYLTGSYPLRFDSSNKIANQLLWIQIEDLGIDYIDTRNDQVKAVTFDDIKRVAKRLIEANRLITIIVGKPETGTVEEPAPAVAPSRS
jgi:zinc protease